MPKPTGFVEHVLETMRLFGPVDARAMFGGWGLYHEGTFFALIIEEGLYLKTDDENVGEFKALKLEPFVYPMKGGDKIVMSYYQAPEETLESREVMAQWARSAYGAALRAKARKRQPRRKQRAAKRRS